MSYPNIGQRSKDKGRPVNQISNKELIQLALRESYKGTPHIMREIERRGIDLDKETQ